MYKLKTIILTLFLLLISTSVMAASSAIQNHYKLGGLHRLEIVWTAHTTGAFTSLTTHQINGLVFGVETDPGTTAPTDNYNITLTDQYDLDIMGGSLTNRDTANTEFMQPYNSVQGSYLSMPVHGALTLAISGNSQNGATGKVIIYYFAK